MQEVFGLRETQLPILWRDAFVDAAEATHSHLAGGYDVLLQLHASWFHIEARGLVPAIHAPTVNHANLPMAHVVTLIDDVYDTFDRLTTEGHVFAPVGRDRRSREWVMLKILQWREFEVQQAKRFAADLGIPHYLFAVKHRIDNFERLLKPDPFVIYLSHPITDVRAQSMTGSDASSFARFLRDVSDQLGAHSGGVVVEPTAIDEMRFEDERTIGPKDEFGNRSEHAVSSLDLQPPWPRRGEGARRDDELLWTADGARCDRRTNGRLQRCDGSRSCVDRQYA